MAQAKCLCVCSTMLLSTFDDVFLLFNRLSKNAEITRCVFEDKIPGVTYCLKITFIWSFRFANTKGITIMHTSMMRWYYSWRKGMCVCVCVWSLSSSHTDSMESLDSPSLSFSLSPSNLLLHYKNLFLIRKQTDNLILAREIKRRGKL